MSLQETYSENVYLENMVKTFLDLIVLAMLNETPSHGYQIIADLHITFGVLLSPGTLYPLLYNLEKENLVKVKVMGRKKLYFLTLKGRNKVSHINKIYKRQSKQIFSFIDNYLESSKI